MSSREGTPADADEPSLDAIADELYALRPDAFAAARDEQVRKARAAKRPALARELGQLRRPTQSAWLVNLLWRDQPDVLEQLFELADELSRAQAQASGAELRSLTARRREIEAALLRRAHTLAENAGVKVTDAMAREAQDTLAAAVAQPEVADEVRSGRLVKPTAYAGFGPLVAGCRPQLVAAPGDGPHDAAAGAEKREAGPSPRPKPAVTEQSEPAVLKRPKPAVTEHAEPAVTEQPEPGVIDLQAAQRARERREAAERRVREAREALAAATSTAGATRQAAEAAGRQHQERLQQLAALRAQLSDLHAQLSDLQAQLRALEGQTAAAEQHTAAAEQAVLAATRSRDQADRARQAALKALQHAEHELDKPDSR